MCDFKDLEKFFKISENYRFFYLD